MLLLPPGPKPMALLLPASTRPHYIYMIHCCVNNKVYIGQTVDAKVRWTKHKSDASLSNSKDHKQAIHIAILKHGLDNFVFHIIEVVDTQTEANEAEIYWIDYFHSSNRVYGYNRHEGGQVFGGMTSWCKGTKGLVKYHGKGFQEKIIWPNDQELLKLINDNGLKATSKQLNITMGAIIFRAQKHKLIYALPPRQGKKGEANITAKLNASQVLDIVRLYNTTNMSHRELAVMFNVNTNTITAIMAGRNWSHITGIVLIKK